MLRSEKREQAFLLVFESLFDNDSADEIIIKYNNTNSKKISSFAKELFVKTLESRDTITKLIKENLKNWDYERLSRVSIAIMQLAICEMLYEDSIPRAVSINEAVELAKKYGKDSDPAFVNGVLSSIDKKIRA